MILSDYGLKDLISKGELCVDPLGESCLQPASIDCRLGNHFLLVDEQQVPVLSLGRELKYREVVTDSIVIPAKTFLLATTKEYVKLPNGLTAFVEGRSSVGRMGLFIQNAGWVDAGFEGNITLELYNANSLAIELQAGRRICQLVFCRMDRCSQHPYAGKYQGQRQTVGSRAHKDDEVAALSESVSMPDCLSKR